MPNTAKDADQNLTNLTPILAQNGQDSYTVELIWETNAQTYQFQIADLGSPAFSIVGEKHLWCVKRVIEYDPKQKKGVIQTNIHKNTARIGSNAEPEFNTESVNSNELIKFIRQYEETKIAMQKLETDGVKAKVEIDICWEEISKNQTGMNCFGLGQTELSKEQLMEKFGNAEFPIMKRIVTENSDALIFLSNLHSTTEKNIREIFIDLGLSSIFIVSSKRFEYLCDSSGFFGCYALTLQ